jgi:hypothetical protein
MTVGVGIASSGGVQERSLVTARELDSLAADYQFLGLSGSSSSTILSIILYSI